MKKKSTPGLQGFPVRAHHFVRHRGHAYDSERTDAGEKRHPPVSPRAVLLAGDVSSLDDIGKARPSTVITTAPRTSQLVLCNAKNTGFEPRPSVASSLTCKYHLAPALAGSWAVKRINKSALRPGRSRRYRTNWQGRRGRLPLRRTLRWSIAHDVLMPRGL
jgi:hypothetical protein